MSKKFGPKCPYFWAEASGPKRLWAEVALVRSVFGPMCLTFNYSAYGSSGSSVVPDHFFV